MNNYEVGGTFRPVSENISSAIERAIKSMGSTMFALNTKPDKKEPEPKQYTEHLLGLMVNL